MSRLRVRWLPALLLLAVASAQATPATVQQPRPYGWLVGDRFEQRILLEADGRDVELDDLPAKDKLGVWFLRRDARIERDADLRRWLVVDYQLMNASKDVDRFVLPAWTLKGRDGARLDVPEWPMTAGAIVQQLTGEDPGLPKLQPDLPPPPRDEAGPARRLQRALAALVLVLAAWLGWWRWREWRAAQRLPFARALRALRRLDPDDEAAWRCLHRAFDEAAGSAMSRARLEALFVAAPALAAARADIEAFFIASEQRFFGGRHPPVEAAVVLPLAQRLRVLERAAER